MGHRTLTPGWAPLGQGTLMPQPLAQGTEPGQVVLGCLVMGLVTQGVTLAVTVTATLQAVTPRTQARPPARFGVPGAPPEGETGHGAPLFSGGQDAEKDGSSTGPGGAGAETAPREHASLPHHEAVLPHPSKGDRVHSGLS